MITPEQLANRRDYLGSSEISAIFSDADGKSLNQYANAIDIFVHKVYNVEPVKLNEAMKIGNRYESALAEFASEELRCDIQQDSSMLEFIPDILDKNGVKFTRSHPDGYTLGDHYYKGAMYDDTSGIECKTTSLSDEWDATQVDGVPFNVLLQCQHQMLCTGWKRVFVPVLLGGFRLQEHLFMIERNDPIIAAILTRIVSFWNDNVLAHVVPEDSEPGHIDVFKRIIRQPESWGNVDTENVIKWEALKEVAKQAKVDVSTALAMVLIDLGDNDGAHLDDGREFTYFTQMRNGAEFPVARIRKGR